LLPPWLTQSALDAGELERVLPGWESPPVSVYAIYRRNRRGSPAVRAFIEAMTRG
jgi:DNA-binding transcriptional LysR family regulator